MAIGRRKIIKKSISYIRDRFLRRKKEDEEREQDGLCGYFEVPFCGTMDLKGDDLLRVDLIREFLEEGENRQLLNRDPRVYWRNCNLYVEQKLHKRKYNLRNLGEK